MINFFLEIFMNKIFTLAYLREKFLNKNLKKESFLLLINFAKVSMVSILRQNNICKVFYLLKEIKSFSNLHQWKVINSF